MIRIRPQSHSFHNDSGIVKMPEFLPYGKLRQL